MINSKNDCRLTAVFEQDSSDRILDSDEKNLNFFAVAYLIERRF